MKRHQFYAWILGITGSAIFVFDSPGLPDWVFAAGIAFGLGFVFAALCVAILAKFNSLCARKGEES